ncbi:hypothetical protein [Saccharicrinis aurantiacus]|uniref:hypothetical protein n=1 Tax=Saccharicrinis aurantiacus TaxID=1849719 RepID=UPI0008396364|nr:hypothetical protein [Saccharicrinis aurantiacus]
MKNFLAIAAMVVFGFSSQAGNKVMVYHNQVDDKYVVSVWNDDAKYQSLEIKDSYTGGVILSESMEGKDFVQEQVSIDPWGASVYKVELDSDGEAYEETLVFIDGQHMHNIINIEKDQPENSKVFMEENNDNLVVSHFNPKKETLELRIYDGNTKKAVEEEYIGDKKTYTNKVDISELKEGNDYTLALKEGDTVYLYQFTK